MLDRRLDKIKVKIEFEFSQLNNKVMSVEIYSSGHSSVLRPQTAGIHSVEIDMVFPAVINLNFSGKDNNTDTIVIDDVIVDDLCVKITNMWLDGIKLDDIILCKLLKLITVDNRVVSTNYIGFNGNISMLFDKNNIFDQLMQWKRKFT